MHLVEMARVHITILLFGKGLKRHADESIVKYCANDDKCHRHTLFRDFDDFNPCHVFDT